MGDIGDARDCVRIGNGAMCGVDGVDRGSQSVHDDSSRDAAMSQSEHGDEKNHEDEGDDDDDENQSFEKAVQYAEETLQLDRERFALKKPERTGKLFEYLKMLANIRSPQEHQSLRNIRARGACGTLIEAESNNSYHTDYLPILASDIDDNVISTVVEHVDMKFHGVRLFTKFCYDSFEGLPNQAMIQKHICVAHMLARECFPSLPSELYLAVAHRWTGHVRYNNNARNTTMPLIRCQLAMVWPHIVVHDPEELMCFYTTLNMRLTTLNADYQNPVDSSVLVMEKSRASLQTIFSHKVVNCKNCRTLSVQLADYESSDEDQITRDKFQQTSSANSRRRSGAQQQRHTKDDCVCKGSKLKIKESPTVYLCDVVFCPTTKEARLVTVDRSTLQSLDLHAIIPQQFDEDASKHLRFVRPEDAPKATDPIAWMPSRHSPFGKDLLLLCAHDNNKDLKALLKLTKTTERMLPAKNTELYELCTKLVRSVGSTPEAKQPNGAYANVVIQNITRNKSKGILYVNVQGRNARFCYLHGADHIAEDARVYFVIRPIYYSVNAYCNNPSCQTKITAYFDCMRKQHDRRLGKKSKKAKVDDDNDAAFFEIPEHDREMIRTKMHFEVSIESNLRDQLMMLVLEKHYNGPTIQAITLQQKPAAAVQLQDRKHDFDPDSSSDMEDDVVLGVKLPRHLLDAPYATKCAYMQRKHAQIEANKEQLERPSHCSYVRTRSQQTPFTITQTLIDASIHALRKPSALPST